MSERNVLALVPYPLDTTPSQRFRLEQWAPLLARDHGIHVEWSPFADARLFALLARPGRVAGKAARILWATAARVGDLVRARRHDVVVVHRAACLAGPAWLERALAAAGKPLLFDFDDAIWVRHTSGANALFDRLKFPGKTATLCRLAGRVVAGCEYLAAYARQHRDRVTVVPTSIDTHTYVPRPRPARERVVVGWSGSATSLTHLESFVPVLRELLAQRPVELRVLSTREPVLPGVPVTYRRWTPENEVEEIGAFDVGIKPMPDDPWSRGKCPMKELQYMALGVPAVCSDVGTAGEAVRSGENGFLARSTGEWIAHLVRLADDAPLRARLGEAGRRTVVERYSAESSARAFAEAVHAAAEGAVSEDEAVAQHSREAQDFTRGYEQLERDPYATCFAYSRRRLDLLLERLLPKTRDGRALDVGCGTGHHLARLLARGYRGAGVDGSGAMLAQARALVAAPLAQGDVTRLPFASAAFDVALCVEVLRYLPDGGPLLREIARVLRPGGTCLVTAVPRLSLNGYPLVNRLFPRGRGFSPLRQYFTSVRALRRSLEVAGLVPEAVHAVYWGPVNWVERLVPRRLPVFLKRWERIDEAACARTWTAPTANMLLAVARKPEGPA